MKRISALILSAVLILSLAACGGQADTKATDNSADADVNISSNSTEEFLKTITPETAEAKGVCGADLTWYYQDNVLVIKGTGPMTDYDKWHDEVSYPWSDYYDKIGMVVIGEGCTSIGEYAFYNLYLLSKVVIPEGVESIGGFAFCYCRSLEEVTFPDGIESIGEDAFYECSNLSNQNEIVFPASLKSIGDNAFYNTFDGAKLDTITFLGDAPEEIWNMLNNIQVVGKSIEVYYSGSGFDKYIEDTTYFWGLKWIKQ